MRENLRPLAIITKLAAIVIWLGLSLFVMESDFREVRMTTPPMYRDAPADWGTPQYKRRTYARIVVIAMLTLMAVIPNGWIVRFTSSFILCASVAVIPFFYFLFSMLQNVPGGADELWRAVPIFLGFIVFYPLPISLLVSWLRVQRGETVFYA